MKKIDITGGMSISQLATEFGKVVDKSTRRFTVEIEIHSLLKLVNAGVQVNAADKAQALAMLSDSEKAAVSLYEKAAKQIAARRMEGAALAERWTVTGTASLV